MKRLQGYPDPGDGLRLHLNENTGGCSPKVVEAVRSFTAERLALYPDFAGAVTETAAFLGVNPDWLVLTNGLDEGILLASIAYLPLVWIAMILDSANRIVAVAKCRNGNVSVALNE